MNTTDVFGLGVLVFSIASELEVFRALVRIGLFLEIDTRVLDILASRVLNAFHSQGWIFRK